MNIESLRKLLIELDKQFQHHSNKPNNLSRQSGECAKIIRVLQEQVSEYDKLALYIVKFAMPWNRVSKVYENMLLEIKSHAQSERLRIKAINEIGRKYYPIKWWQLWRWNGYWESYTFRYKWMRDLYYGFLKKQNDL